MKRRKLIPDWAIGVWAFFMVLAVFVKAGTQQTPGRVDKLVGSEDNVVEPGLRQHESEFREDYARRLGHVEPAGF